MVAMWDHLAESVIMVETPLSAVSWQGAMHSHLRMMELPRCWCGAAYDDHKSCDTHSDHDAPRTPAGAYHLPCYDSASLDTSGCWSPYDIGPAHTRLLHLPTTMGHAPHRLMSVDHKMHTKVLPTHVGVRRPAPACCCKSAGSTPCTLGSLHCERRYGNHC
jgi:hypothetical protein